MPPHNGKHNKAGRSVLYLGSGHFIRGAGKLIKVVKIGGTNRCPEERLLNYWAAHSRRANPNHPKHKDYWLPQLSLRYEKHWEVRDWEQAEFAAHNHPILAANRVNGESTECFTVDLATAIHVCEEVAKEFSVKKLQTPSGMSVPPMPPATPDGLKKTQQMIEFARKQRAGLEKIPAKDRSEEQSRKLNGFEEVLPILYEQRLNLRRQIYGNRKAHDFWTNDAKVKRFNKR